MNTDICFIPVGSPSFASSRFRVWWPAEFMKDVAVAPWDHVVSSGKLPNARVYIFQKSGTPELMQSLSERGARIVYDACDPMHWYTPNAVKRIMPFIDYLTFATQALADDWVAWWGKDVPHAVIPDRMSLDHYTYRRQHRDVSPVRFIWFGVANNRASLYGAWDNLTRLHCNGYNIELTILDDRPDLAIQAPAMGMRVYYAKWQIENEAQVIASHDIAVLPPYPGAWGKLKSNNKSLAAWACGLPVTSGCDYEALVWLVEDSAKRAKQAAAGFKLMLDSYITDKTAAQWTEICASL